MGKALFPSFQPDQLQHIGHASADIPGGSTHHAHGESHVIIHVHVFDEAVILEHNAQGAPHLRQLVAPDLHHVKAVDDDPASIGPDLAGDQLHQTCLA